MTRNVISIANGPNGKECRIRAFTKQEKVYGYTEPDAVHYQVLEEKTLMGWKEIDREIIPCHVKISIGCFGYDDSGWKSKFKHLMSQKHITSEHEEHNEADEDEADDILSCIIKPNKISGPGI